MTSTAVSLFAQTDSDLLEMLKTEAEKLLKSRENRHARYYRPARNLAYSTQQALRSLQKRRLLSKALPENIAAHIRTLQASADADEATFRALTESTEELETSIALLRRLLNGDYSDEADLDEADDIDNEDEGEQEEEADYDDDNCDETNASDDEATDVWQNDTTEQTLIALQAEMERRRSDPSYCRVAALEDLWVRTYGAATTTLRDIIVAAIMLQHETHEVPAFDGIVVDDEEVTNEAVDFIGPGADDFLNSIADARNEDGLGAPAPVTVLPIAAEDPPRLDDGVARRYFRCPCCRERFSENHSCTSWNCHTEQFTYLADIAIGTRCAFTNEVRGVGIHRRSRRTPFGRSLIARRNARTYCVLPTLGYSWLRREVRKRFNSGTITDIAMLEDGMHVTEQLPALATPGTAVSPLLEVHNAQRFERPNPRPYEHWWFADDGHCDHHGDHLRVIEYATAYDVIEYRGRERSTPTVIGESLKDPSSLGAAIPGDRLSSPFGPRVERVEVLATRLKQPRRRAGETDDPLTKTVKNGSTWKVIHLTVDPIESYDDTALTAAVEAEITERAHGRDLIALRVLRELGAHGAARLIREANEYNRDDDFNFDADERFQNGYQDAAEYLAAALTSLFRCPDCGVYETHHEHAPFPCGERRQARNRQDTQLALLA